jgi:hypothetical protein
VRAYAALYLGGMGSREQNFYHALATRMGFGEAADRVQERYLARDYLGAAAEVPLEFIDATSLLGPKPRIAERMRAYADAGVTTLTVAPFAMSPQGNVEAIRVAADALASASLGEPGPTAR